MADRNQTKHFTDAARRATARGDHALAAAINALPHAALADVVTYSDLTDPVAAAIDAAEANGKSRAKSLDKP